jgi:hypothetical protein
MARSSAPSIKRPAARPAANQEAILRRSPGGLITITRIPEPKLATSAIDQEILPRRARTPASKREKLPWSWAMPTTQAKRRLEME